MTLQLELRKTGCYLGQTRVGVPRLNQGFVVRCPSVLVGSIRCPPVLRAHFFFNSAYQNGGRPFCRPKMRPLYGLKNGVRSFCRPKKRLFVRSNRRGLPSKAARAAPFCHLLRQNPELLVRQLIDGKCTQEGKTLVQTRHRIFPLFTTYQVLLVDCIPSYTPPQPQKQSLEEQTWWLSKPACNT